MARSGSDENVGQAAGQRSPRLARIRVLDLADADTELEELLHALMEPRPLVAVAIFAGVEEGLPGVRTERIRELRQEGFDLGTMALETFGVEADGGHEAFCGHMVGRILSLTEEAVEEDLFDLLGVKRDCVGHVDPFIRISRRLGVRTVLY